MVSLLCFAAASPALAQDDSGLEVFGSGDVKTGSLDSRSEARGVCVRAAVIASEKAALTECRPEARASIDKLATAADAMQKQQCAAELPLSSVWTNATVRELEQALDRAATSVAELQNAAAGADLAVKHANDAVGVAAGGDKAGAQQRLADAKNIATVVHAKLDEATAVAADAKGKADSARTQRDQSLAFEAAGKAMDATYQALIESASPSDFDLFVEDPTRREACQAE